MLNRKQKQASKRSKGGWIIRLGMRGVKENLFAYTLLLRQEFVGPITGQHKRLGQFTREWAGPSHSSRQV